MGKGTHGGQGSPALGHSRPPGKDAGAASFFLSKTAAGAGLLKPDLLIANAFCVFIHLLSEN